MQPAAADPSSDRPAPDPSDGSPDESGAPQQIPAQRATGEAAGDKPALTDREREILAFEARWWKHAGAKEQAIRDTFALSSTRYYQLLNALLDKPEATEHDPVLVGRLRRLRATRARTRRR
ncbi:DUF3263 domain-containing protein [Paractinoplanes rhizophilus]|jgi:hypothetical protein|uniref:DUF3263 domain-containing protein n=1 Tax=Paractinoplanes rhizophilus TaxID=1416877 RepID=A0ABW2HPX6_9ACTN|nr:DUF3263 domain-containing protein [Actinoplanes sp.]